MNNVEKLEKIRKYIEEKLYIPNQENINAIRTYIKILRETELITLEEKYQLLYYAYLIIHKQKKGD